MANITEGGNNGERIIIDNLYDGSLEEAVRYSQPRHISFLGVIGWLETNLKFTNPFLTIDGGGLVGLRSKPDNVKPIIRNETHDVFLTGLAVRAGPGNVKSVSLDCISTMGAARFWFDRGSFYWSTDENVDIEDSEDIEFSRCVIAEGLYDSMHGDNKPHSMGFRIGDSERVSFHHGLIAHCWGRSLGRVNNSFGVDIAYNLCYNPGDHPSTIADSQVNYRFNNYIKGPNSKRDYIVTGNSGQVYVEGNEQLGETVREGSGIRVVDTPFPHLPIPETPFRFSGVGIMDATDRRIINDVLNGTGKIIDHPDEVGGWLDFEKPVPIPPPAKVISVPVSIEFENSEVVAAELVETDGKYKAVFTIE